MGREARINAAKGAVTKTVFIATVKHDFSYELVKEPEKPGEKEKTERVENYFHVPFASAGGWVVPFISEAEATNWLKDMVNSILPGKALDSLTSYDVHILQVKYAPEKRTTLTKEWIEKNVKSDLKVELKKMRSAAIN